nr:immunoglobulin heavy chain junction region [Homo sapiens]MBN4292790.1 immunoglobulin heavy chain junction region [Homo sapiens]MBN4586698.1 immunoglobulin heavy chain junction region [Homo sapiens]
LQMNSLRAEDT